VVLGPRTVGQNLLDHCRVRAAQHGEGVRPRVELHRRRVLRGLCDPRDQDVRLLQCRRRRLRPCVENLEEDCVATFF
jgi:hypothetical protein